MSLTVVHDASKNPTRMLVVDDEATIRFALQDFFDGRGMRVDTASSRFEAEHLLDETHYDILIVDLKLSPQGVDEGLDVVEYTRNRKLDCHIIVLSAYGTRTTRIKAGSSGADVFIDKPIRLEDLSHIIDSLLNDTL